MTRGTRHCVSRGDSLMKRTRLMSFAAINLVLPRGKPNTLGDKLDGMCLDTRGCQRGRKVRALEVTTRLLTFILSVVEVIRKL